ncbi:putative signal transduction protein with a C-terminal ATPase domain [Vibrio nigripulchritudo SOn1]|uniref:Signal transduction protein with a C-terminal ATPase domain n=1 Tax=Vibrio nigripulchritudo SOn1 TaxID=1238450 RepID=A0AAV2VPX2_9VIBR|nr:histidine kinase [Vibrio nigripulchritudo]CCO46585.1 putative signal transduction protein with a C-terminal ATPase domain [Vibrio nigripulchritudo SOn1]
MGLGSELAKNEWLKSFLFTSLFCFIIAITTSFVWEAPFYTHIVISFGFGYSAVVGGYLVTLVLPELSRRTVNLVALTISMLGGSVNAHFWVSDYPSFASYSDMKPIVLLGFIFTAFCFYYFYSAEQKAQASNELEKARRIQADQEKALVLSELQQLQSQIEPHFLFNTLANINVLIESDPSKAKQMLSRLTDLLRATLRKNRTQLVPVDHELDLLSAYLGIQQIRLGELMSYNVTKDEFTESLMVPPFLLQPLVENAVIHGLEPSLNRGHIDVKVLDGRKEVVLEVRDNGVGLLADKSSGGHGIGLQNIRARLKTLFGEDASLSVIQNDPQGVTSRISINRLALGSLQSR